MIGTNTEGLAEGISVVKHFSATGGHSDPRCETRTGGYGRDSFAIGVPWPTGWRGVPSRGHGVIVRVPLIPPAVGGGICEGAWRVPAVVIPINCVEGWITGDELLAAVAVIDNEFVSQAAVPGVVVIESAGDQILPGGAQPSDRYGIVPKLNPSTRGKAAISAKKVAVDVNVSLIVRRGDQIGAGNALGGEICAGGH